MAYTVSNYPTVAIKAEIEDWWPNYLGYETGHWMNDIPILVNPNKCVIGWHRTHYTGQLKPDDPNWFFPNADDSKYGSFARWVKDNGDIMPGRMREDGTFAYVNRDSHIDSAGWGVDQLYVDCFQSLKVMSTARLINISYEQNDMDLLLSNVFEFTYNSYDFNNTSSYEQNPLFEFSLETSSNASVRVKKQIATFSSFEFSHESTLSGFIGWITKLGVKIGIGAEMTNKFDTLFQKATNEETEIQMFSSKNETFKFSQNVKLAPNSRTTIHVFSRPHRGSIPFKAVYEVRPNGTHNLAQVTAALQKYGYNDFNQTGSGTILAHFLSFRNIFRFCWSPMEVLFPLHETVLMHHQSFD